MQGGLIEWIALFVIYKGDELAENALLAHTELFAQALAGEIVLLSVEIDASRSFLRKKVVEIGSSGFQHEAVTLGVRHKHPARGIGVRNGLLRPDTLRFGKDFTDDPAVVFARDGKGQVGMRAAFQRSGTGASLSVKGRRIRRSVSIDMENTFCKIRLCRAY